MAELLQNPSSMAKAREELGQVIGSKQEIEGSDIGKLKYLQAIVKETFRLHPIAPLLLPRQAEMTTEIRGYTVPKGARVLVNVWAIGRDTVAWDAPEEFRPERFLGGGSASVDFRGTDYQLIPFGAGRRICAGKLAGMVFVQYFLGTLLHAFDWRLPEGEEKLDMSERFGLALPKAVPLRAVVTPRLVPEAYA